MLGLRIREEKKQQKTTRQSMLEAFKREGELNTAQINRFGTGCSSRIKELRKDGHKIVTIYEKPGCYRYVYLGLADEEW